MSHDRALSCRFDVTERQEAMSKRLSIVSLAFAAVVSGDQLTPDDRSKYTIEFGDGGRLTARIAKPFVDVLSVVSLRLIRSSWLDPTPPLGRGTLIRCVLAQLKHIKTALVHPEEHRVGDRQCAVRLIELHRSAN
jgi:hypothetical protein